MTTMVATKIETINSSYNIYNTDERFSQSQGEMQSESYWVVGLL